MSRYDGVGEKSHERRENQREWDNRLIEINRKIDEDEFTEKDVPGFMKDFFRVENTGIYEDRNGEGIENPEKTILRGKVEKIKSIIANYYGIKEEEICTGDVDFEQTELEKVPYRIIFGNASFKNSLIRDINNLQIIGGNAIFGKDKLFRNTKGKSSVRINQIKNLHNLQFIGGFADVRDSKISDIGKLQVYC